MERALFNRVSPLPDTSLPYSVHHPKCFHVLADFKDGKRAVESTAPPGVKIVPSSSGTKFLNHEQHIKK